MADDQFTQFVSRNLYTRVAQSNTSFCFSAKPTQDNLEKVKAYYTEMMDRWLAWVDLAQPVAEEERSALAARDLFVRQTIANRDPANVMADKFFGKELASRLVGTLWGKDRQNPRPS